jgi:uncharacterized protein YdiU (UPF0061 family)
MRDNRQMNENASHLQATGTLSLRSTDIDALGGAFFTQLHPTPLPDPYWVARSEVTTRQLGLSPNWMDGEDALALLVGNQVAQSPSPLATVYSGHQFGVWAGQLGDGRAILLGQTAQGQEIQLKGAGRTPYSRGGDGRAVLRSSIREFLCSEAMHGLGIPTTRALCIAGSDHPIYREETETAAVVTRVAPSFIRFGHFEHFSYRNQHDELRALADQVIDRHYPECRQSDRFDGNPYAAFLETVSERTAQLLAQWQAVGFCHGVMNTDNMSILGLTIDYGPFQFLDAFVPAHICNHSDTQGRYAFNRQPNIAYWNLYCLGQALLPLIDSQEQAIAALESYKQVFPAAFESRMCAKLGMKSPRLGAREAIETLLSLLAKDRVDYTIFWRRLSRHLAGDALDLVRDLFLDRSAFDAWMLSYSELTSSIGYAEMANLMLKTNPAYILRNHLGEQAIRTAKLKDYTELHRLQALLHNPFDESPGCAAYADFPPDWAERIEISCSS